MVRLSYFIIFLFILIACSTNQRDSSEKNNSTKYARGFEITDYNSFKKITVFNPWEQAKKIAFSYYLMNKGQIIPDSLKKEKVIFTPIERVICLSTSHIAFLDAIGETAKIKGISGSQYVNNNEIRNKIQSGEVVDVGYDSGLNYELILQQKPDLVLVYGIGSEVTTYVRKMEDLGLTVFFIAEYLEESPLGKTEWINCIAPLFGKEKEANLFFKSIESKYNLLKEKANSITEKPEVLVGLPYRDAWWIPGGKSYLSNLIADAGGDYIGKDNSLDESYVVSFENLLTMAGNAKVWLNVGSVKSKAEIIATDERFAKFPSFNNARIYNNNNRMNPSGGNDFWESGAVYPDRILHDFINIFHPGILEDSELIYYREIN
ncbi:MAG: ABC transporter substrate-binding protein [Mariniphaga sp.]|nr:ABC transporter substrate-binding protein [Mariniphaga sp.]